MASQTTNLELVKQANNENWSNDIHNANLEKIDAYVGQNATQVTDLNNCTDPMKNYWCNSSAQNAPIALYLMIRVINANPGTNSYYSQIAMPMNSTTARMWIRTKTPTEWSPWKELADASQLATDWGTKTTDWLASAEQGSGASAVFSKAGKMVTIGITTVSRAHSENDVIATIETGFRPNVAINVIGTIGNTPCVIRFATDGTVSIWLLSAQTSGRVYVTATFAIP